MPVVQNPSIGAGATALLLTTTHLTAAQIRTLASTPVQLVAAPGAGKLIVPFFVVFVFDFGTVRYTIPAGGTDQTQVVYSPSLDQAGASTNAVITAVQSVLQYQSPFSGTIPFSPGDDNAALAVNALSNYDAGPIVTAAPGAGGLGYAANDTGTITTGSGDATYKVLTVGAGGAVLTFQITAAGTAYEVGNGQATATGGAQPGVGVGFTVNITAVQTGDGTLKVVTYYEIIAVP